MDKPQKLTAGPPRGLDRKSVVAHAMGMGMLKTLADYRANWMNSEVLLEDCRWRAIATHAEGKTVVDVGLADPGLAARVAGVARTLSAVELADPPTHQGESSEQPLRGVIQNVQFSDWRKGSFEELPYTSNQFDLVYAMDALAFASDAGQAIDELVRVCNPGGYVIAEFRNTLSLKYLRSKLADSIGLAAGRHTETEEGRWDEPWTIRKIIPPNAQLLGWLPLSESKHHEPSRSLRDDLQRKTNAIYGQLQSAGIRWGAGHALACLLKKRPD